VACAKLRPGRYRPGVFHMLGCTRLSDYQAVRLCSRAKKAGHATFWAQALLGARRLEEAQEAARKVGQRGWRVLSL
jgi:hypothetical protein